MSERVRVEFQSGQKKAILELHSYRLLYNIIIIITFII